MKRTQTVQQLTDGFRSVLAEKAFDDITINDIAKVSGHGRAVFYYHFCDKFDILEWLLTETVVLPFQKGFRQENGTELIGAALNWLQQHRGVYLNLKSSIYFREICQLVTRKMYLAMKEMLGQEGDSFQLKFMVSGIVGTLIDWLDGECQIPAEVLAGYYVQMSVQLADALSW